MDTQLPDPRPIDIQLFAMRPPRADSNAVLQAALATLPGGTAEEDDVVLAPTAADMHAADPVYSDTDDDEVEAPGGQPPAVAAAPAGQPAAPARPTPAGQPAAPAAATPGGTAAAVIAPPAGATDPWADTEDITYTDDDTGQTYQVRVPKTSADAVRNGYERRSMLNRKINFLGAHRAWIEPLVTNKQLDQMRPFIERGLSDREFGEEVAKMYQRRTLGLPMIPEGPAGSAAAVALGGPAAPAGPAGQPNADVQQILAQIDARTDLEDYTKDALKALATPLVGVISNLQSKLDSFQTEAQTERQQQADRVKTQQTNDANERRLGFEMRTALQTYFPTQFTDRTPANDYVRVLNYAQEAGLFQQYGRNPGTVILAYQQLTSPTGGLQGSPGARSVAEIRSAAEQAAAGAAATIAGTVAPGGPSGAAAAAAPRVDKVPRYVVDPRTKKKRPLTAMEVSRYMEKHPNAVV